MTDKASVDRELNGGYPYFAQFPWILFINRDLPPSGTYTPLALTQWLSVVANDPALVPDEVYTQHNIDRGVDERWREPGRARWSGPGGNVDWFRFMPANIGYIEGSTYHGGPSADKWRRIMARLPGNPPLASWLALVDEDPYLRLDGAARVDAAGPDQPFGDALWLGRDGRIKHRFRYHPASVWISGAPLDSLRKDAPYMDVDRVEKCQVLARCLNARVRHGDPRIRGPMLR